MSTTQSILGTNSVNETTNLFKCADRVSPGDEPKDITSIKELYIPFDIENKAVHLRKNPFGAVIYRNEVSAGNIYGSFDGKRLVLEVGCDTIVYIHINPSLPSKHHRIFIQSERAFSGDTTIRRDSAEIVRNTQHIETIVKYELFFVMGVLSTVNIPTWVMVTGADITVMYAKHKKTGDATKVFVKKLTVELDELKEYAPTLHTKIIELFIGEAQNNAIGAAKKLPETIAKDEKTQAQVAGIIFGKWAMPNNKSFNVWTIVSVVLTQAAIKSVTKYGETYLNTMDSRYKPFIEEMKSVDPRKPESLYKPAQSLIKIIEEAGVKVSLTEAKTILTEIANNREKAFKNLNNISNAIAELRKATNK